MARDKYAHVRELEHEAVDLIVLAQKQWWRFLENHGRYKRACALLDQAGREIDLIAERSQEFREAVERRRAAATPPR